MSLIRIDGFDTFSNTTGDSPACIATSQFYTISNLPTIVASADTRSGVGHALQIQSGHGMGFAFDPAADLVFGIAFVSPSFGVGGLSAPHIIAEFCADNYLGAVSSLFQLTTNPSGALTARFGSEIAISPVNSIFASTWHYIEGRIKFAPDSTGAVEIRVDGNTVITYAGPTSGPTTGANMMQMYHAGDLADWFEIDDLYLLRKDGLGLTDFLGDCVVHSLMPTTDAGPNEMTMVGGGSTHASSVNEIGPDDDTTYVHSNTIGQREFYNVSAIPADIVEVLAVQVNVRARKDTAGIAKFKIGLRSGSTESYGPLKTPPIAYLGQFAIWETDPAGGVWTKISAQAAQIGIQVE
jgi:hypothetical protein